MKRILIILLLAICGVSAKAQDVYDQCVNVVSPIIKEANALWFGEDYICGYTPERQAKYARYCIKASDVVEEYLNKAVSEDDKVELMWLQLRIMSNFLYFEDGQTYNGLQPYEYKFQVDKYISIANKLLVYSNNIQNRDDRNLEQAYIAQNLGYIYFYTRDYQKAVEQFNVVITKYSLLLNSTIDADEVAELGQS